MVIALLNGNLMGNRNRISKWISSILTYLLAAVMGGVNIILEIMSVMVVIHE